MHPKTIDEISDWGSSHKGTEALGMKCSYNERCSYPILGLI